MFLSSFALAAVLLFIEGFLAAITFGDEIQPLYNENFLDVPVVSQIVNFYPMLNVSAVPVLVITLRNNIFQLFKIEITAETTRLQRVMWSLGL